MVRALAADRSLSLGHGLRIRPVTSSKRIYGRHAARVALPLVWCVALASATILYSSGVTFQSHAALLGLGAAFGGAAGNLLDIFRRGAVLDFIDLGWWPVFNLADVAILAGLVVAFWPLN